MAELDNDLDDPEGLQDFCRVCRCEGTPDRPLFYPCLCIGSIKYVHQECLMQWLKYSKREYCELCKHKFTFTPIYSADMPQRLPLRIVFDGVSTSVFRAVSYWLHYTLVAVAWLCIVPLTACRISRCLFTGSVASLVALPLDLLSTNNILTDCLYGLVVVVITLAAFIGYVWLREQILQGGGPDWLQRDQPQPLPGRRRGNRFFPALFNFGAGGINLAAGLGVVDDVVNEEEEDEDANAGADVVANQNAAGEAVDANANGSSDEEDDVDEAAVAGNPADGAGRGVDFAHPPVNEEAGPVANDNEEMGPAANRNEAGAGWPLAEMGDMMVEADNDGMNRAAEELTWERLLGLDGSLVFLEHVFWVVSLNTFFVLVFAFCPYHIGHFTVVGFHLEKIVEVTRLDGLMTTLIGYIILASLLVLIHFALKIGNMNKARHFAGIGYIVIKVALLSVFEIGFFPSLCGLWLDVCSMGMFNATLAQRNEVFHYAPVTFVFMHWMVGMMYIFYFASFLLVLREVLRPGVFWFIRNFNDPDFSPVHDMIMAPVHQHFCRFILNCTLFGTIIMLMVWLPVRTIKFFSPTFLPYTFNIATDTALDYSVEIFFLQVVLPLLFDGHAKLWLKSIVKVWCSGVAWILDLRSYLLGDEPLKAGDILVRANGSLTQLTAPVANPETLDPQGPPIPPLNGAAVPPPAPPPAGANGEVIYRPYRRPSFFLLRVSLLFVLLCVSLVTFSLSTLTLPVECGRQVMRRLPIDAKHDLFALLLGLAGLGMTLKTLASLPGYLMRRGEHLGRQMLQAGWYLVVAMRIVLLAFLFLGIVPAVLGVLVNFIFITPFRVPMNKSLVVGFWEHWIFGLMHLKAWILLLLVGPRWWMREGLEAIQDEVMRRDAMRITHVFSHASPLLSVLALSLAGPYVIANSFAPLAGYDKDFVFRRIYPFLFTIGIIFIVFNFQIRQFKRLYEHIKNDRYLIGQRLVNYGSER